MHVGNRVEQLSDVVLVQSKPALTQGASTRDAGHSRRMGTKWTQHRHLELRTKGSEKFVILGRSEEPRRESFFAPQGQRVGDEIRKDDAANKRRKAISRGRREDEKKKKKKRREENREQHSPVKLPPIVIPGHPATAKIPGVLPQTTRSLQKKSSSAHRRIPKRSRAEHGGNGEELAVEGQVVHARISVAHGNDQAHVMGRRGAKTPLLDRHATNQRNLHPVKRKNNGHSN
jgi:hypothetical protein